MRYLICSAVLLTILGWASACDKQPTPLDYHPLELDFSPHASGVCATAGEVICSSNCKQVVFCTRDETVWLPVVVQNCTAGTYCDAKQRACHSGLSTCSPTSPPVYRIHCTAVGLYPDPYDCSVFHVCPAVGVLSTVSSCDPTWAFDSLTGRCDLPLTHRVCEESPIPKCLLPAQSGPVVENPNIYYVCLSQITGLLPELFRCEHSGMYNGVECVEEFPTTEDTTTAATTTTTTTEPPITTEPPTTAQQS